jgi:hypothetical protein
LWRDPGSKRTEMRILRGLSSQCLPCGCLAGVYETYDGLIVTILDAKGTGCRNVSHCDGKVIPTKSSEMPESSRKNEPAIRPTQD